MSERDLSLRMMARGLSRVMAAIYVGVSPSLFDEMVHDGRMPRPKMINRRKVWDKKALDEASESLPDDADKDVDGWGFLYGRDQAATR